MPLEFADKNWNKQLFRLVFWLLLWLLQGRWLVPRLDLCALFWVPGATVGSLRAVLGAWCHGWIFGCCFGCLVPRLDLWVLCGWVVSWLLQGRCLVPWLHLWLEGSILTGRARWKKKTLVEGRVTLKKDETSHITNGEVSNTRIHYIIYTYFQLPPRPVLSYLPVFCLVWSEVTGWSKRIDPTLPLL